MVIPNYNGVALLPEILPPLMESLQASGLPWDIIVSDDHSTDGSVAFLTAQYPQIRLIRNSVNRGFGPTINEGIRQARYDLVFLLNNDVKTTPDYFVHQLPHFEDEHCFGVMGRIIGWDDSREQEGAKFPRLQGWKIKTNTHYAPADSWEGPYWPTMYLSGANALVRRDKLLMLGGFEDLFSPFYVEDVDLGLRAWRVGWTCQYEPRSVCRHRVSVTIQSKHRKSFIRRIYYRNKALLQVLHLSPTARLGWYLQQGLEALLRLPLGQTEHLLALRDLIRNRASIRRSRQSLQSLGEKTGTYLSLKEVTQRIRRQIGQRRIEVR